MGKRLLRPVAIAGIGVHTGLPSRLTVHPAPWGTGRVFRVGGVEIRADLAHARAEAGSTVLVAGSVRVGTPEHLLAALAIAGISDAWLDLDGLEVPILDGSAQPWLDALGATEDGPPQEILRITRPFAWSGHGGELRLDPGPGSILSVDVDFGPGGPAGRLELALPGQGTDVAAARTFVLSRDVAAARAAGRGKGADATNTVVLGEGGSALRVPDEPIRHKALDAIGDLALLGTPVEGRITVIRGSHRLHVDALRAWRA